MPSAAPPPTHRPRRGNQNYVLDAEELSRRLSIVIAEERVRELERKRSNWELELLQARREQADRVPGRSNPSPFEDRGVKRPSIALGPTQHSPTCDSPPPHQPRRTSLSHISRPPGGLPRRPQGTQCEWQPPAASCVAVSVTAPFVAPVAPRKSPAPKRDGGLDLETIQEVDRLSKETRRTRASRTEDPSEWAPVLWRVEEDGASASVRSGSRSHSGSHGRPSLFDKFEHCWRFRAESTSNDTHAFHSDESTLRESWMSSLRSSVASRKRSSIIKRVENYWSARGPGEEDEKNKDMLQKDSIDLDVKRSTIPRKRSGLFSKLRI